jgi:hypothetical protein
MPPDFRDNGDDRKSQYAFPRAATMPPKKKPEPAEDDALFSVKGTGLFKALDRYGFKGVWTVAAITGLWMGGVWGARQLETAGAWLGENAIKPVFEAHVATLNTMSEAIKQQAATQSRQVVVAEKQADAMAKIGPALERIEKYLVSRDK